MALAFGTASIAVACGASSDVGPPPTDAAAIPLDSERMPQDAGSRAVDSSPGLAPVPPPLQDAADEANADDAPNASDVETEAEAAPAYLPEASVDGGARTGCRFASGLNVAWVNFASDVPNPNMAAFNTIFANTRKAGGRVIRWWFHTNGTVTPGYDANGMVQKITPSHIAGVTAILNAAHAAGVWIDLSLWSFDMLQANAGNAHVNNQALLTIDANRQSYIDNYLTPLVLALKGNPGLYAYEVFNEPEGMTPTGWATYRVAESYIQRTVNWFAAAIHAADPAARVTNGAQEFQYCSNVSGKTNFYSDAALLSAGGRPGGTLDFYEVHYYTVNGSSNSCFLHPASYWGLDKKLVMGEFFAAATDGVAQNDTYTYLYANGYNGAWAWSYDADKPWPSMQVSLQNLYAAQPATVDACP
ncbi:MAG: cellulase family glycosylhydrolase [Myxococcota bacterium]|nr:cellulase family glycosylhydrolase [Myxococcota bacterium]